MAADDRIFQGVVKSDNSSGVGTYCSCRHVVVAGVQCRCGADLLVEPCDMVLGECRKFDIR